MAPKICEKLAQGINALCMSEEKADVHFKLSISMTDPKVTKRIPAHTFLLREVSPPFEAMFSGNWREAANGEDIEVPDIVAGTFERLMEYVYKGEAKLGSMDTDLVIGLYYAAKKYEISDLISLCMDFFRVGLVMEENGDTSGFDFDVKDAFTLLEYCMGKDEPELRARAIQLIQRFTKEALESNAFLDSSRATVEVVFSLDELSVSENFLFKAAFKWTKYQCAGGGEDPGELRREMGSILELIRFPTMERRDFCRDVAPTQLLTEVEGYQILLQICSDGEPPVKKTVSRFSRISRKLVEGTRLSLKIAHFPDIVAAGYLEEKYIWVSDKLQVCGCFWSLSIDLRDAEKKLSQKDHPPKYLGVYLRCLPPTEANECDYHVDACFHFVKARRACANAEEEEDAEIEYADSHDYSFTHVYSCGNHSWGFPNAATCEKLLDPKNGYLSTDGDDQSLEVAVTFFATKVECHKKKEE